jgi:hypothetical protein
MGAVIYLLSMMFTVAPLGCFQGRASLLESRQLFSTLRKREKMESERLFDLTLGSVIIYATQLSQLNL